MLLDEEVGNDAWPKGLVPLKAAPSHSGLEDGIVIGKGLQYSYSQEHYYWAGGNI